MEDEYPNELYERIIYPNENIIRKDKFKKPGIHYSLPVLSAVLQAEKRKRQLFILENQITCLADQLQSASDRSTRLGRGITREMKQLSARIMNLQADYKGMAGKYFYPKNSPVEKYSN